MQAIRSLSLRTLLGAAMLAVGLASSPLHAEPAKPAAPAVTQPAASAVQSAMVNINTADAQTLASELTGVGEKKAEAIVAYRQEHGPFKSVDELANVTGIGPATVEKNRARLSVN